MIVLPAPLPPILAAASQAFAVLLIVAAAVGYLLVILRRSWRSGEHGACGGCSAKRTHPAAEPPATSYAPTSSGAGSAPEPARPQSVFIPVENLKALARHRRQSLDAAPPPAKGLASPQEPSL